MINLLAICGTGAAGNGLRTVAPSTGGRIVWRDAKRHRRRCIDASRLIEATGGRMRPILLADWDLRFGSQTTVM
jgi:hypothetical protein